MPAAISPLQGRQWQAAAAPVRARRRAASVGRRPSSDLLLDWDDQVSRLHARFERVEDEWEIVDDGLSSNGTFVNEERLNGRRRLKDGDTLRFGSTTVHLPLAQGEQSSTAKAARTPVARTQLKPRFPQRRFEPRWRRTQLQPGSREAVHPRA